MEQLKGTLEQIVRVQKPTKTSWKILFKICYDFYDFRHQFGKKVFQVTTKSTVTDYDVNDSNELLVGAGQDGSFVAWNLQSGLELRRIQFAGKCFNIFDTL